MRIFQVFNLKPFSLFDRIFLLFTVLVTTGVFLLPFSAILAAAEPAGASKIQSGDSGVLTGISAAIHDLLNRIFQNVDLELLTSLNLLIITCLILVGVPILISAYLKNNSSAKAKANPIR